MKRFFYMWATLALAIVLAWGASYFAPVASAAGKLELTDAEKAWLAEHKRIRLGVDPAYPPFDFIAEGRDLFGHGV